jgi:CHAT domain-containing protein/tetratricopeptide (TPR) repeat protein
MNPCALLFLRRTGAHRIGSWLIASGLALAMPAGGATLDDAYLELANNALPHAAAISDAAGDAATDPAARHAARVARLDVLETAQEVNALPQDLTEAELSPRLTIVRKLAAHETSDAQRLARAWFRNAERAGEREAAAEAGYYLAISSYQRNDHAAALQAADAALHYWQAAPGLRARWRETLLQWTTSKAHYSQGHFDRALTAALRARALATGNFGAGSELAIRITITCAGAAHTLGRLGEERDLLEAALAETRKAQPDVSAIRVVVEGAMGNFFGATGDYVNARAHFDVSETIVRSGAHLDAGDAMRFENGFGVLLLNAHDERAALEHFSRALAAFPDDPSYAITNAIIARYKADAELMLAQYDAAQADYTRSIALRLRGGDSASPGVALAYHGLGAVALAQSQFAEAERHFRRALAMTARGWNQGHPEIGVLQFGLALARWGQHDDRGAFRHAVRAAKSQSAQFMRFVSGFEEEASVRYRPLLVPATALAVTLAAKTGDADEIAAAWELAMQERASIADDMARRFAAAHALHDARLRALWDSWREANQALVAAWTRPDAKPAEISRLREAAQHAERTFWKASGLAVANAAAVPAIAALAQALPQHGRLLAIAEGLAEPPARLLLGAQGAVQEPEEWYAFVLTRDAPPRLEHLGSIKELSATALAWYTAARNPRTERATLMRDGAALRRRVFDASGALDDAGIVFFVPDGELFRVNPAALPSGNGFVIEHGVDVQILDHERDLLLPRRNVSMMHAVLAGAPNFGAAPQQQTQSDAPTCLQAQTQGFAAIPQAARELHDIKDLLAGAFPDDAHIELVEGQAATVDGVLGAVPGATIVHFATHGFSLDETCTEQTAVRGVALTRNPSQASDTMVSGLAFANATLNGSADTPGILSSQHLMFLDLSQASWVVLSACDSGLGPIKRGEGVFGMRRALRLAGATTVIMSLWEIEDAATAQLMLGMYRERFEQHSSVPHALAQAARDFLRERRAQGLSDSPYYWAAFIAEGGWL